MLNFLKKNIFRDKKFQIYMEFEKIQGLQKKVLELDVSTDVEIQMKDTQRNMLMNNFLDISYAFDLMNNVKFDPKNRQTYLNFQGTPPRVIKGDTRDFHSGDTIIHKDSQLNIQMRYLTSKFYRELLDLEEKFINLNTSKLNPNAKKAITKLAVAKVERTIKEFCDTYGDDSDILFNFIMYNLSEPSHTVVTRDIKRIIDRIDFVYTIKMDISQELKIAVKDVIYIDLPYFNPKKDMNIEGLLKGLSTGRYDFIIGI